MKIQAGIWIDHHKAVVLRTVDQVEDLREVLATPAKTVSATGEVASPPDYNRDDFVAEDRRDRKEAAHLRRFYDEVIRNVQDAESILILGPGEAKGELRARIAEAGFRGTVAPVQTADKMTKNQFVECVRKHFG
ncbi:MAG: hypothetical protein U0939_05660 [Pirellulales bacterium]